MKDMNLKSIIKQFGEAGRKFKRYGGVSFFVLFALVYGFVVLRINSLTDVQVNDADVSAQVSSSSVARIEPSVVTRLESLKDNSVNVQSLFEQGRANPFQE